MKEYEIYTPVQLTRKPHLQYSGEGLLSMAEPIPELFNGKPAQKASRVVQVPRQERQVAQTGPQLPRVERPSIAQISDYGPVDAQRLSAVLGENAGQYMRNIDAAYASGDKSQIAKANFEARRAMNASAGESNDTEILRQQRLALNAQEASFRAKNTRDIERTIREKLTTGSLTDRDRAELQRQIVSNFLASAELGGEEGSRARDEAERLMRGFAEQNAALDAEEILNSIRSHVGDGGGEFGGRRWPGSMHEKLLPQKFQFSFAEEELIRIMEDPLGWMDERFDEVYNTVASGNGLQSQTVQQIIQDIGQAQTYVMYLREITRRDPSVGAIISYDDVEKELDAWERTFAARFNLIVARSALHMTDPDRTKESAGQLRAAGLFYAHSLDGGRVEKMHKRFLEMLEDKRNREGGEEHYFSSEMMHELHGEVVSEQVNLAIRGKGMFKDRVNEIRDSLRRENQKRQQLIDEDPQQRGNLEVWDDATIERKAIERLRAEVQRTERTAYDAAEIELQVGDRIARGEQPPGDADAYSSSPSFLTYRIFRADEAFWRKYKLKNVEAEEMWEEVKLDIANWWLRENGYKLDDYTEQQRRDLGAEVFMSELGAADFYSSIWRRKEVLEQMNLMLQYGAENEALVRHIEGTNNTTLMRNLLTRAVGEEVRKRFREDMIEELRGDDMFWHSRGEVVGGESYQDELNNRINARINELLQEGNRVERDNYLRTGLTQITKTQRDALLGKGRAQDLDQATREFLESNNYDFPVKRVDNQYNDESQDSNRWSPWKKFREAAKTAEHRAEEFGIFLRMQGKDNLWDKREQWETIAKYRPEEVIRIFRTKEIKRGDYLGVGPNNFNSMLAANGAIQAFNDGRDPQHTVTDYDSFKFVLGADMRIVRDYFMDKPIPEQVNFASIQEGDARWQEVVPLLMEEGGTRAAAESKLRAIVEGSRVMQKYIFGGRTMEQYMNSGQRGNVQHVGHEYHALHDATGILDKLTKGIVTQEEAQAYFDEVDHHTGHANRDKPYVSQAYDLFRKLGVRTREDKKGRMEYAELYNKLHSDVDKLVQKRLQNAEDGMHDHDKIHVLLRDIKYRGVYARAQNVDDLFLSKLQTVPANSGIVPISQQWTAEMGQDALARTWGDAGDIFKGMNEDMMAFLNAEGLKAKTEKAESFALRIGSANGQNTKAEAFRFTAGTYVKISRLPIFMDAIGIKKKWFRQAATRAEEIYGPAIDTLTYGDTEKWLDHYKPFLVGAMDREKPEDRYLPEKERKRRREHSKHAAEQFVFDLEYVAKKKTINFLWRKLIMLAFMASVVAALEMKDVMQKSGGAELKAG